MGELCSDNDVSLKHSESNVTDDNGNTTLILDQSASRTQRRIDSLLEKIPELNKLYAIHSKVGEGTFSTVYRATLKTHSLDEKKEFAIKHLIPTSNPSRVAQELRCLLKIGGKDNVVGLEKCLRKKDNVVFIMPYLPHDRFGHYLLSMDLAEIKEYMKHLIVALRRVHSFNIIHRDIKPSNFLYDRLNKRFLLVDFGLAEEVKVSKIENNSASENISKKRKHSVVDENENGSMTDSTLHPKKRPALQPLTNTVNSTPVFKKPNESDSRPPFHVHSTMSSGQSLANILPTNQPVIALNNTDDNKVHENALLSPKRLPLSSNSVNIQNRSPQKQFPRVNLFSDKNKSMTIDHSSSELKNSSVVNEKGNGKVFQTLLSSKLTTKSNGSSFFRVQNSQVKTVFQCPVSPATSKPKTCDCDGRPQVCTFCLSRRRQVAARAGTPGFRPPEVLLKYSQQTTAVDMWAAGVIFLSLISGCYPFFRSADDLSALAEIMSLFGTDRIKRLAIKFGKRLRCSYNKEEEILRKVCVRLRRRRIEAKTMEERLDELKKCEQCGMWDYPCDGCNCKEVQSTPDQELFPDSAYDLLSKLLDPDHDTRITAVDALNHPFFID